MNTMNTMQWVRTSRSVLFIVGMLSLVEAAGLGLHIAPFTGIWPLGDASAVDLYLGAYMAAIGASLLWISISGELRAAVAGGINLTVAYAGLTIAWFVLSEGTVDSRPLRTAALLAAVAAVVSAGIACVVPALSCLGHSAAAPATVCLICRVRSALGARRWRRFTPDAQRLSFGAEPSRYCTRRL